MKSKAFLILTSLCLWWSGASAYADEEPSRTIHLVYDDSGSMIHDDAGVYLDTWCQARYSMEVVAAMLAPQDELQIFYMSSYASAPYVLYGKDGAAANVEKIHTRTMQYSQTTPFKAVEKAFGAFKPNDEREKWLVVLSDGVFEDTPQDKVEQRIHAFAKSSSTQVAMLAMGNDGPTIAADPTVGVYYERADSRHILDKLTKISNQIFKRHTLEVRPNHTVQFGVPMRELVVLAQGRDVKINGLIAKDGTRYASVSNVHASSDYAAAAENIKHPELVVPCALNGYVAQFEGAFAPGEYTVDVSGADSVVVYFKPNVSVAAYLYPYGSDAEKPISADENLVNGRYAVKYGLVSATPDRTPVQDVSLLESDGQKIVYTPKIINKTPDGSENEIAYHPNKPIEIQEGTLSIRVDAQFLKYTRVFSEYTYDVHYENELVWQVLEQPRYGLTVDGFDNATEPLVLEVKMKTKDGKTQPLTAEEWGKMPASPSVVQVLAEEADPEGQTRIDSFHIEKVETEIGKYRILPKLLPEEADRFKTRHFKQFRYEVSAYYKNEETGSTAHGYYEGEAEIEDKIGAIDRIREWVNENPVKTALILLMILALIGYGPQKKRLPKTITIKMTAERTKLGKSKRVPEKKEPEYGRYVRHGVGVPWPFCRSHKADIHFDGVFPTMQVRASNEKYMMTVLNPKEFESVCPKLLKRPMINYTSWKFDGEDEKKFYKYTCRLTANAQKK